MTCATCIPFGPNSLARDCDNARVANLQKASAQTKSKLTMDTHLAGANAANLALPLMLAVAPVKIRVPLEFLDISLSTA